MSKVILRNSKYNNRSIIYPIFGELKFDEEGKTEVNDLLKAEQLCNQVEELSIVNNESEKGKKEKTEEIETTKKEEVVDETKEQKQEEKTVVVTKTPEKIEEIEPEKEEEEEGNGLSDEEQGEEQIKTEEDEESDESEGSDEDDDEDEVDKEELIKYINSLKLDDLKKEVSKFKEDEETWSKFKVKSDYQQYLISKL